MGPRRPRRPGQGRVRLAAGGGGLGRRARSAGRQAPAGAGAPGRRRGRCPAAHRAPPRASERPGERHATGAGHGGRWAQPGRPRRRDRPHQGTVRAGRPGPAQAVSATAVTAATGSAGDLLSALYLSLTPREREILELYADGNTDKEIAGMLGIRPLTVRNHMAHALLRCDIHRSDRETRLWFALAVTGRHRFPERILRRIEALRDQEWPT